MKKIKKCLKKIRKDPENFNKAIIYREVVLELPDNFDKELLEQIINFAYEELYLGRSYTTLEGLGHIIREFIKRENPYNFGQLEEDYENSEWR